MKYLEHRYKQALEVRREITRLKKYLDYVGFLIMEEMSRRLPEKTLNALALRLAARDKEAKKCKLYPEYRKIEKKLDKVLDEWLEVGHYLALKRVTEWYDGQEFLASLSSPSLTMSYDLASPDHLPGYIGSDEWACYQPEIWRKQKNSLKRLYLENCYGRRFEVNVVGWVERGDFIVVGNKDEAYLFSKKMIAVLNESILHKDDLRYKISVVIPGLSVLLAYDLRRLRYALSNYATTKAVLLNIKDYFDKG